MYGSGSGSDCRRHVQKLNALAAEIQNQKENMILNECRDESSDEDDY